MLVIMEPMSQNSGKDNHLAAPMLMIMEPMFPTIVAKRSPGCSHVGDYGANVSQNGGKDNHSHYLAASMLVIMEPMFPMMMMAKTITPTTWLLLC
jgi:hypothetical protein